jgi:hypothetical protein
LTAVAVLEDAVVQGEEQLTARGLALAEARGGLRGATARGDDAELEGRRARGGTACRRCRRGRDQAGDGLGGCAADEAKESEGETHCRCEEVEPREVVKRGREKRERGRAREMERWRDGEEERPREKRLTEGAYYWNGGAHSGGGVLAPLQNQNTNDFG